MIRALATSHFLDFLGIRLDSATAGDAAWTVNLVTPDNDERFVIELSNGTLTNLEGFLSDDPDLTITIDRTDLEAAMTGARPLLEQVEAGTAVLDGDASILTSLADMLVHFELGFEIMPGTGAVRLSPELDPFATETLDQNFC
jgi:alkyl sulfatase BDS1-like metallo-beta-lactamase superfamily hydrolase